jgi:hypothetical protein
MSFVHLLLEVYCSFENRNDKSSNLPSFCGKGANNCGYHCFENACPFVSYTNCSNEIAYVGEEGEVKDNDSWVGFGGEMEPIDYDEKKRLELLNVWERICKKKIDEAYEDFMIYKNKKELNL